MKTAPETAHLPVPRVKMLSSEALNQTYLSMPDSHPVVLNELTQSWRAMQEWTFDYFDAAFGDERVIVTDFIGSSTLKKTSLKTYLSYVRDPLIDLFPGTSVNTSWYAPYWSPLGDHAHLRAAFDVSPAIENWLPVSHPTVRVEEHSVDEMMVDWALRGFTWLFIGPAGTVTPRHIDTLNTHAWNTQIKGAKRFDLWEPSVDGTHMNRPPDLSTILDAGETLIIPSQWSHSVTALSPSISLTGNFFNRTNCVAFFEAIYASPVEWQAKGRLVPALAARMPK